MDIQIVNPQNYPDWDELLLTTPGNTFFHSSPWARITSESYQYKPQYFTVFGQGKFIALIPIMEINSLLTGKRGVSLPFTDYCEPLIGEKLDFNEIFKQIIAYGKKQKWKFVEFRGGESFFSNALPCNMYFGHILTLSPDDERMFSNLKQNVRRNIKKAVKDGVRVEILHSVDAVQEFYKLNCLTRRQHGLPPQPFSFFKKLHNEISRKSGFVVLASHDGRYIAGSVYLHFGDKAIYKYGASDMKYQHLRPNNLVMWEAIKWYCNNGYGSLCLGRTDMHHQGLRQFKTGWGAVEYTLKYYKYDLGKGDFIANRPVVGKLSNNVFRKMPLRLLNILGTILYRHMG